jgi:hypothetical protein
MQDDPRGPLGAPPSGDDPAAESKDTGATPPESAKPASRSAAAKSEPEPDPESPNGDPPSAPDFDVEGLPSAQEAAEQASADEYVHDETPDAGEKE